MPIFINLFVCPVEHAVCCRIPVEVRGQLARVILSFHHVTLRNELRFSGLAARALTILPSQQPLKNFEDQHDAHHRWKIPYHIILFLA